jgi:hypothetical protein
MKTYQENTERIRYRITDVEYGFVLKEHEKKIKKIGDASSMPRFIYIDGRYNNVIKTSQNPCMRLIPTVKETSHNKIVPPEGREHVKQKEKDYRQSNGQYGNEDKF